MLNIVIVIECCVTLGRFPLMVMKEDWTDHFKVFATVQFEVESTKLHLDDQKVKCTSNIYEIAKILELDGTSNPEFIYVHKKPKFSKSVLKCL